jgi:ATPase subunit of ABC transporter with duplicated ATPase domains
LPWATSPAPLGNKEPSPGEIRKVLLTLGVSRVPHLIIMDEPTNHLDLPSIDCLEHALAEYPCGVLLVSHDQYFLDRLTTVRWHIATDRGESRNTHMRLYITGKQESGQNQRIQ